MLPDCQMRYYSLNTFFKERFGCRVFKLPVNAGFSCPNRDGSIGTEGCIFCWNPSFSPVAEVGGRALHEQIEEGKSRFRDDRKRKYLVYFQPYTNTYAPLPVLARLYLEALQEPDVIGICVATRPDCLPVEVVELLDEIASRYHVWLELGLQSCHDRTLELINRGHRVRDFVDAVSRCRDRGFFICAHVILGLPGESREDMLATADFLSSQPVDGVKIHHLQVIDGTRLASMYRQGLVPVFTIASYVRLVCDFLERLRPDMVIHRLLGDTLEHEHLLAPVWKAGKAEILGMIEHELARRESSQGSCRTGNSHHSSKGGSEE